MEQWGELGMAWDECHLEDWWVRTLPLLSSFLLFVSRESLIFHQCRFYCGNWADVSTTPPSSSGLIPYGLAPDKPSKWTDLVVIRQAKRIQKNGEKATSSSVNDL